MEKLRQDALSYMAGYGLKAYLITQDIRQIVDAYGQNESIVSNCHVRIAFAPNQVDTAELLSKMTGTTTVQKASFNFSGPGSRPSCPTSMRAWTTSNALADDARRSHASPATQKGGQR